MIEDDRRERRDDRESAENERGPEENESFLDEELIPFLLLGGILLFLFPEPATSALGVVLVGIGVGLWVIDLVGRS